MSVKNEASEALDGFIDAVYAMYDYANTLIKKYGLTTTEVMLAYRATVELWHMDNEEIEKETDDNYE